MPIEVELPNGGIAEFPDDTSPEVIQSTLQKQFNFKPAAVPAPVAPSLKASHKAFNPQEVQPQAEETPQTSGAARDLGLGTRNVLEGLGGVVDAFINKPANAVNAWLGGDPNYFKNPGAGIADTLGLPKPENRSERIQSDIAQGAAGMLPTLGLGLSAKAAEYAPQVAKFFGSLPIAQIFSGASSGAASGAAREMGAGPAVQTAAALLGGGLPIAAVPAGRVALNSAKNTAGLLDRLTESGQNRAAGDFLRYFARNPEKSEKSLADGVQTLVDGSEPTLAQATGDSGFSILEKGLRNTNAAGLGGDITERYAQQAQARRDALNPILDATRRNIDEAIAKAGNDLKDYAPGYMRDPQSIGADIGNAFDDAYAATKNRTNAAYDAVDPDKTASFDVRPLRDRFAEVLGSSKVQEIPPRANRIMKQMEAAIKNGENWGYAELQDARRILADVASKAAKEDQKNASRIATRLTETVDDYLENGAMKPELMGGSPTPQPGSRAYKDATAFAKDSVNQDAWYNDLEIIAQQGLNRDAVEKLGGKAMVEEFNRVFPGLVRRNGKMMPDTATADLDSFNALTESTGGGTYFANGDDFLNAVLERLGSSMGRKRAAQASIRDAALQQNARPHTGFSPEQAAAYQEAKNLRRYQGETFEQGANKPLTLRGNKQGGGAIDNSAIPGNYVKNPEAANSFMRSVGESESARQAIKDFLVKQALQEGEKNGAIDVTKLGDWLQRTEPVLNELSASKWFPYDDLNLKDVVRRVLENQQGNITQDSILKSIARKDQAGDWLLKHAQGRYPDASGLNLSEADRATLDAVRNDAQRAYEAAARANVAGSPTAQLQRIEKEMDRAIQGVPFFRGPVLGVVGKILNALSGNANDDIMRLLNRATLDPALALKLMRGANTASKNPFKRFVAKPNTTAWNTLKATGGPQAINAIRAIMAGLNGANQ